MGEQGLGTLHSKKPLAESRWQTRRMRNSCLPTTRAPTVGDHGHLRGREEPPENSCFHYIFIFPNIYFIFLILFFDSVLLLLFVCLFVCWVFFVLLCQAACRILVPRPEVGPELLWWELWVQIAGLTENLRPQRILIGGRLPRRSKSQHQDPALSNCLQTPVLDASGQTTSKRGIQPRPSKKKKWQKICYRRRRKVKTYKTK